MTVRYKRLAVLTAISVVTTAPATAQIARSAAPVASPGTWIRSGDYPADAIRAGKSGRVVVDLAVDDHGRVTACRLHVSSDTPSLDATTCRIMIERAAFTPAIDLQGRPIATTFTLPVRWVLPATVATVTDLSPGPRHTDVEFEEVIGPDGAIAACNVLTPIQDQLHDPCTGLVTGSPTVHRYVVDGKPVGVVLRQRYTSTVTATPVP